MKRGTALRYTIGIVVMLTFAGAAAACDSGPTPPTQAPSNDTPTAGNPGAVAYRTPLETNGWTLTTSGFKRYEFLPSVVAGSTQLKPLNGVFGVILLNATNRSATAAKLDLSTFKLVDDGGHTFAPDVQATQQYSGEKGSLAKVEEPVAPGATTQVGIAFDLPATTYTFMLHALDGTMDPGTFPAK